MEMLSSLQVHQNAPSLPIPDIETILAMPMVGLMPRSDWLVLFSVCDVYCMSGMFGFTLLTIGHLWTMIGQMHFWAKGNFLLLFGTAQFFFYLIWIALPAAGDHV